MTTATASLATDTASQLPSFELFISYSIRTDHYGNLIANSSTNSIRFILAARLSTPERYSRPVAGADYSGVKYLAMIDIIRSLNGSLKPIICRFAAFPRL